MKATYINNLTSSFYLWLDHEILSKGEAFTTYSGKLYNSPDPNFPNASVYSSPFKQWVYDSSITSAYIPSGIYSGNNFVPKSVNNLKIDYGRGRAVFDNTQINPNALLSAKYSFKDYNIYYTDEREDKILFEGAYSLTPYVNRVTG